MFWTPRIGYAYNWNDPCVRFRQEATVDIHTHITSADTHTHITSADIHAHMLGHADAHLVIAGHHTCITSCACTYSMCMYMRMSTTHLVIVGHHTCCGTLETPMRTLHLHSVMQTCSLDKWATWPTRLRPHCVFLWPAWTPVVR